MRLYPDFREKETHEYRTSLGPGSAGQAQSRSPNRARLTTPVVTVPRLSAGMHASPASETDDTSPIRFRT